MNRVTDLAEVFEDKLGKTAGRKKSKTSRKQILKKIDKSKASYQTEKRRLSNLERQKERLEADISACRDSMRGSRSNMLKLKQVLGNMDLADCNYVMMYDNEDCGYLINGEEYRLDVNDEGEVDKLLMKEYRRSQRASAKEDAKLDTNDLDVNHLDVNDLDANDLDSPEEEEEEEELKLDKEGFEFPNFRLLD